MSSYFLEHYGVVGMKWGKRKAGSQLLIEGPSVTGKGSGGGGYNSNNFKSSQKQQKPKDAQYKSSGSGGGSTKSSSSKDKKGYKDNPSDPNKPNPGTTKESSRFDPSGTRTGIKDGKSIVDAGVNMLEKERKKQTVKTLKEEAKSMSDDDLKKVINRISMEEKYTTLMEKQGYAQSKTDLQKTLEMVGEVAGYADTALSIYEKIQGIRGR